MARSRRGGSSGLLSGKVGNVIYSITRNADGSFRQQIATNPEERFNPNTDAQARARCTMATIERAMFTFADFVASGWEGIENGTLAVSEFSKVNYNAIKEQIDFWWDDPEGWDEYYDLPKKGQTAPRAGAYQLSRGSLSSDVFWTQEFLRGDTVGFRLVSVPTTEGLPLKEWLVLNNMLIGDEWTFVRFMDGTSPTRSALTWVDIRTAINANPNQILTRSNYKSLLNLKANVPATSYMVQGTSQIVIEFTTGAQYNLRGVSVYGLRKKRIRNGYNQYNNCELMPNDAWADYNAHWQNLSDVKSSWLI